MRRKFFNWLCTCSVCGCDQGMLRFLVAWAATTCSDSAQCTAVVHCCLCPLLCSTVFCQRSLFHAHCLILCCFSFLPSYHILSASCWSTCCQVNKSYLGQPLCRMRTYVGQSPCASARCTPLLQPMGDWERANSMQVGTSCCSIFFFKHRPEAVAYVVPCTTRRFKAAFCFLILKK